MTIPNAVDLSSIIGRIVQALRTELRLSQAALSDRLTWDRSLLARIESGRNTANIDNIFELEEVFMVERLISGHGDLVELCSRVAHEAKRKGFRPVVGRTAKPEDSEPVETAALDRIVARVVDEWLDESREAAPPTKKRKAKR